jgi:hypothetical protein
MYRTLFQLLACRPARRSFRPGFEVLERRIGPRTVNTPGDDHDADADDGVADADLDTPGLQTTLTAAIDQIMHDGSGSITLDIDATGAVALPDTTLTLDGQGHHLAGLLSVGPDSVISNVVVGGGVVAGDRSALTNIQAGGGVVTGGGVTVRKLTAASLLVSGTSGDVTAEGVHVTGYLEVYQSATVTVTNFRAAGVVVEGTGDHTVTDTRIVGSAGFVNRLIGGKCTVTGNYFNEGLGLIGTAGATFHGNTTAFLSVDGPGFLIDGNDIGVMEDGNTAFTGSHLGLILYKGQAHDRRGRGQRPHRRVGRDGRGATVGPDERHPRGAKGPYLHNRR